MKLFFAPGACSLSPHIVLNEAGLSFDKVKVDTKSKAMEGGDYRSINPLGYVPALELDDGTILTEGPAIVQWIADQVPEKKLAPTHGSLERTKLQSWLNFISSELHKGFSPLFNAAMPDEAKQFFRERLATRFQHLDRHLADKDYLMGRDFSVADAYLFTVSNWAAHTGVDLSGFPNVLAYRKRVLARPAVKAAMQAEGLIK
jgi:glutathione S-transferase